jgi:putative membrane protein
VFYQPGHDRPPHSAHGTREKIILQRADEVHLLPAHMPPKYHIFDLFPFSLLVQYLTKRGKEVKGKKAARLRAKMRKNAVSHNLPLEISLYLVS